MKKLLLLLAFACLYLPFISIAQPTCGFDHLHKKLLTEDPSYARTIEQNEESIRRFILAHPEAGRRVTGRQQALYTIPVVVHVVHTGGPIGSIYNPSDAQIIGAIDYLNDVFAGTAAGMTGGVGDLEIEFVLAQRDPNCNPTNGIDRVDGSVIANYAAEGVNRSSGFPGVPELSVKNLSRWNTSQYYNIWVVNRIDGADGTSGQFIAGYAYFPGSSSLVDGTVMLATTFESGDKTLPHEVGHAFNLYHVFEGSANATQCPANTNCNTQGDRVCDTDPISYNQTGGIIDFNPRTGSNPCASPNNYMPATEHNYMNYTNVFTLFTAGQKARMHAAMSLPSRSSLTTSPGGTPTHMAPVCPPKINFELVGNTVTENTVTTSGCRSYRDYTFNMVIGAAPTATATATLNISAGSATEGVDFDVTTNGNFTTPSKVLTFPNGSVAFQPFIIRVYDDAIVDGAESFTLNFTVNNGGGNALLGDGKPTFTLAINDNDVPPIVPGAPGTGNIGSMAFLSGARTFDARVASQRTLIMYRASELTAAGVPAGDLTGIAFTLQKQSTRAFSNFTIKMAHTNVNWLLQLPSTVNIIAGTTVKTLASYTTTNGLNSFTFDSPFTWNGTSNIVIEICFENGSTAAGDNQDFLGTYTDGSANDANFFYQSGINCSQNFSSLSFNPNKPVLQISYGNPGNPVATTTVTSLPQYLGPNADVYFYSNTGQIMARVTNQSSFDYGCTQVSIDRTGSTSEQFWNNVSGNYLASKSFRIIPANNTTTGNYRVHLYYTQAEIDGWQTTTSQSVSNIRVVKVSNGFHVPDVTPSTPHLADVTSVAATNTAYSTAYVISGDFTSTGFSGFGVGIPGTGSALPITLLSFSGNKDGSTVKLNWKTASEFNNARFEIETSKDNRSFYKIGEVESKGNSVTEQLYNFSDNVPVKGVNYYRLRQVDIDAHSTFSNTVAVTFDAKGNPVITYPNPTKDKMTVELAKPTQSLSLQILGLDGRLIKQQVSGAVQRYETIETRDLTSGTYVLQVKTDTDVFNLKFVKQ